MEIPEYCAECGTKIREEAKFCEGCGKEIKDMEEMKKEIRKKIEEELREEVKTEILNEQEKEVKEKNSKYIGISNRKFILDATSFSIICALIIKVITLFIGTVKFGEIRVGEVLEAGFPLPWLKMSYLLHEDILEKSYEVSSWLNLTVDFIIIFGLAFAVILAIVKLRKK